MSTVTRSRSCGEDDGSAFFLWAPPGESPSGSDLGGGLFNADEASGRRHANKLRIHERRYGASLCGGGGERGAGTPASTGAGAAGRSPAFEFGLEFAFPTIIVFPDIAVGCAATG